MKKRVLVRPLAPFVGVSPVEMMCEALLLLMGRKLDNPGSRVDMT
jgi:hypothetical protein